MKRILSSASTFGLTVGIVAGGFFIGDLASAATAKADPDVCGSVDTYPQVTVCADWPGWRGGRGWRGDDDWRWRGGGHGWGHGHGHWHDD